jgi:DNA-binding IclR family transcriptional regulator
MPIRTLGGGVIAALTISGPSFRVNERTLPQFLAPLEAAAAKISWRCGYVKRG